MMYSEYFAENEILICSSLLVVKKKICITDKLCSGRNKQIEAKVEYFGCLSS